MVKLLQYQQEECPSELKEQILDLMKCEWPQAFEGKEKIHWPDNPETHPVSLIFVDNDIVISHVAVPCKRIRHKGQTYKASGLSEVVTDPYYRGQGFGLKLVKEATAFMEKGNSDIGLFTCEPSLVRFYRQGGWKYEKGTNLIGGTLAKPFRSDDLELSAMTRFFSDKAQKNRSAFEKADVYLELGEKMLW